MTSATGGALYRLAVGHNVAARQKDLLFIARNATTAVSKRSKRLTYTGVAALIAVTVIPPGRIVTAAYLLLGGAGVWAGVERVRAERSDWPPDSRWLSGRKVLAGTLAGLVITGLLLFVVSPRLVAFLILAVCVPAAVLSRPAPVLTFWKERSLIPACIFAGIVKETAPNGKRPKTRRHGQPVHTAAGTRIDFELVADGRHAVPCDTFIANHGRLAGAFRLDPGLVEISHPPNTPASMVRMWVGVPQPKRQHRPSDLCAETGPVRWPEPFRIGEGVKGDPVHLQTVASDGGVHTAVIGATGAGKTKAIRQQAGRALLDPRVKVGGMSGKGSSSDWDAMAPLCEPGWFIDRVTDESPAHVERLLTEVLALARERDAESRGRKVDPPGVLLLIEEWGLIRSHVRSKAGKAALDRVDGLYADITSSARSGMVSTVIITQKPTAESLPTLQRSNITQRLVFKCLADVDMRVALMDRKPTGAVPAKTGEALLSNEYVEQQFVRIDWFTDDDWERLCERAMRLRNPAVEAPPAGPDLEAAVIDVLLTHGPLTATAILDRLPESVRPESVTRLGKRMTAMPDLVRRRAGNGYAWAVEPARPLHEAVSPLRVVPASHAQPATSTCTRVDVAPAQTAAVWKEGAAS